MYEILPHATLRAPPVAVYVADVVDNPAVFITGNANRDSSILRRGGK